MRTPETGEANPGGLGPATLNGGDARVVVWFAWITFAVAVISLLVRQDLRSYFNADYCYAPALVQDLVHMGGRLTEWDVPPAPYFFPDVLVYAAWYAVWGNPGLALTASGVTLLVLFVGGWALVARRLAETAEQESVGQGAVLLAGAALCTFDSFRWVAVSSLTITGHFGVTALAPYAVLVALVWLDAPSPQSSRMREMVLMGIVVALLVLSDMLTVVQVCLPLAAAAGVMTLKAGSPRRSGWMIVATMAGGAALGLIMLSRMDRTASVAYLQVAFSPLCTAIAGEYAMEWVTTSLRENTLASLLPIAAGCGLVALVLSECRRALRGGALCVRSVVVPVFATASVVCTAAAVVYAGRWMAGYVFPVTLGLVFAAVPMVSRLRFGARAGAVARSGLAAACLALVLLNCGPLSRTGELARYTDGAPEWVKDLDREAGRLGLKCGVTDYWLAKPATLFSATGIRMIQSTTDLMPLDWISNRRWCDRLEPQFVYCTTNECISDRIRERDVIARFGVPDTRREVGDMVLLVYRPNAGGSNAQPEKMSAVYFRDWWRWYPTRVRFGKVGDRTTYSTADLIGERNVTIRANERPAGSLVFWLLRTLPRGEYAIRVLYDAVPEGDVPSPQGAWVAMRVARDKARAIGGGMLLHGTNTVEGVFHVDRDSQVDLRILYSGHGSLTAHSLELERLR